MFIFGLLPILVLGRLFYVLAREYEKPKSLTLVLLFVTYYIGSAIGGFFFGASVDFAVSPERLSDSEKLWFTVSTLLSAFILVFTLYFYLNRRWYQAKNHKLCKEKNLEEMNLF